MKKSFFILFLLIFNLQFAICCLIFDICNAQPTLEWARRYPDTNMFNAGAYAMVLDNFRNVYITGYTDSNSYISFCTIKYSSAGVLQWVARFTGLLGVARGNAIAVDSLSNIYVTGSLSNPGQSADYCTIKYNSNGIQQWVRYYDGPAHSSDGARKIAVDNAGNIYVTGESSMGGLNFQYATIKYSPNGQELWVRRYGTADVSTYTNGLAIDNSSNVIVTGANDFKAATVKYDSSGNQLWAETYTGNAGTTQANAITLDGDNNVYITGYSRAIQTAADFFTIKYSTTGAQQWVRRLNLDSTISTSFYEAGSIILDNLGSVYISGYAGNIQGLYPSKFMTVKYSSTGALIWTHKDSANIINGLPHIAIDINNYIYIAGSTYSGKQNPSYITIKYDSAGFLQWDKIYSYNNSYSRLSGLFVDKNYNIYITGSIGNKMGTVKYSQPVGIINISKEIPIGHELQQNFPNPFNPKTVIKFQVSSFKFVKLKVFNLLGREIQSLVNQNLHPGTYEIDFNGSNYSSGVYYYQLTITNSQLSIEFKETKKMILLK